MSGRARWVAVTAAMAIGFHVAIVWATPRAIMGAVLWRFGARFGTNQLVHAPLSDATAREVVRPSPDLAYSFCVLDLSRGPVRVTIPPSRAYMSVALYSATTDNYFVRNDRDVAGGPIDVVVLPPGARQPAAEDPRTAFVVAPTTRGIALVRTLVESKTQLAEVESRRRMAVCAPYFPGTP